MASEQHVVHRHARPRQRWVTVTTAATVFAVGVVLGQTLQPSRQVQQDGLSSSPEPLPVFDDSMETDSATTETSAPPIDTVPVDTVPIDAVPIDTDQSLSKADNLLRGGQAKEAAAIYDDLLAANSIDGKPQLLYRRALCWEELDNFEQAWSEYQSLAGKVSDAGFVEAVQFAQARVAIRMGKGESARWLLGRFALDANARADDDSLSADVTHIMAHLYARQALNGLPRELIDDRGLARAQLPWSADHALDLANREVPAEHTTGSTSRASDIRIADRFGVRPDQLRVDVRLSQINAYDAIMKLAGVFGIEVHWTPASEQFARRHPARCDIRDVSVARFLDLLLDQLSLYWIENDDVIEVKSAGEIPRESLLIAQAERAYRNLRYAVSMHPDSRFAPQSYLDMGSVAFATGDFQDAATFFQELLRQRPPTSVRRMAWFNLGKTARLLNDPSQTEDAFFHVVDESLGHPLAPLGYFCLGRHFLEQDNPPIATKHLVRAVSLAQDSETLSRSTLALAAAYLMGGNGAAANMAIKEQRDAFAMGTRKDVAAFLSALARMRVAADEARARTDNRQLMSSLSRIKPTDLMQTIGHWLVGEAYEILELPNQMAIVFEDGIKSGSGPLCDRMRFRVADYYIKQGAPDMGRQHLETLLAEGTNGWDRRASLRIAEMASAEGDHTACQQHCLQLLASSESEEEKAAILISLGHSFQRQDDHYSAAVCFAGMLPRGLSTAVPGEAIE